ncbi:MAG: DciA family protein [Candidatus Omnitrophota bacterium]
MATHIKFLLGNFLNKRKKESKKQLETQQYIEGILDEKIKGYIKVKTITAAEVLFSSESSNFTYEFNLKKEKLLQEIQKQFPKIKKIKITKGI